LHVIDCIGSILLAVITGIDLLTMPLLNLKHYIEQKIKIEIS